MYTLYYNPGTASMCVHQALIEANAPYRLVLVDLQAGQQRDPAYLKLNPNGVVPTMLIMLMRWSRDMPEPATEWQSLNDYAARMKARPSWKQLYALKGLTEWA